MKISVWTNDAYLKRLIELQLSSVGDVNDYTVGAHADVLIADVDSDDVPTFDGRVIRLSRTGAPDAHALPLMRGRLVELVLSSSEQKRLFLREAGRSAVLDGREIRLTAQEYALLDFLLSKGGEYATRAEISQSVWENASDGLINIYIHYLREKLEGDGERIIISSRAHGYRISEKYAGKANGGVE